MATPRGAGVAESLCRNCAALIRGASLATAAEFAFLRPLVSAQQSLVSWEDRTSFVVLTVLVHAVLAL